MESVEISQQKKFRSRTAAKSRLTLAANKIRDINLETITKHELLQIIDNFDQKLIAYDAAQAAVEQVVDDIENEVEQSEIFREEKVVFIVKAREHLEKITSNSSTKDAEKETGISSHRSANHHQAKLPLIEMPKFSGNHTEWQSFWDRFTAIVHLSDLPAVSKFTYLQFLLKGEALAAISGLALTETNYETARDLLLQRFGRKERIVFSHIQELLNLSVPNRTTTDLWGLYDKLQTHIHSLETLDITGSEYGVILTPLVLSRLPENIRLEWARLGDGRESDLDALLSFLHSEILRRERSQTFRTDNKSTSVKTDHRTGGRHATASALHAGVRSGTGKEELNIVCGVCNKHHTTAKCFSWNRLDYNGRKTQCMKKGLCFLCLGPHRIKDCKATMRCPCSGRHHPLLTNSTEWLQGPKDLDDLDNLDSNQEELNEEDIGINSERVRQCNPVLLHLHDARGLIDFKGFSQLPKVIQVMGWVLRFVRNLKLAINKSKRNQNKAQNLEIDELENAKVSLLKIVQREKFQDEIDCLIEGKRITKRSPLFKFSPVLDKNGLLRVSGRLQMSDQYTYDEKHPIVLPKCHVTLLLVRFQHHLLKHAGVALLLTSLRNNYWIFGLRVLAKKVCRECVPCQRQDSRACDQITAPLPADRISRAHPFSVIGVDHAGPIYCQDTGGRKLYILLFTCGITRAVHLELVSSLSLADFMQAFRKFVARRGLPSVVYSDNAKTFEVASNLVRKYGPAAPSWKFSIPLAPWYGGWWERLVRSAKSALRKSLGRELVSVSELETTLAEVEACLNSRPLTYVEEHSEPLTPSHFLLGRCSPFNTIQVGVTPQNKEEFCNLDKEHRLSLERFWYIWSEDYVRNLPSVGNGRGKVDLKVGAIVLIREEGKPRLMWPMGKVTKLIHSKDGLVRAVSLKTENGDLIRAVQKLHKLEVSEETSKDSEFEIRTQEAEHISVRSGRTIRPPKVLDL